MTKNKKEVDWSDVEELAREYMRDLHKVTSNDQIEEYDHIIFEAVMEAVFGKEVWDEINPLLENL